MYIQLPEGKVCSKCQFFKLLEDYYKQNTTKDGKRPDCKSCYKEVRKEYYNNNKDKSSEVKNNIIKIIKNESELIKNLTILEATN